MFQFEVDDAEGNHNGSNGDEGPVTPKVEGFSLGDRIKFGADIGVVKYIGPVGSHAGTWLGIEWEDPSRGKHSGDVDGVVYFKSDVPNSASFVRPGKVLKLRNLMAAFNERYGEAGDGGMIKTTIKSIEDRLDKSKIIHENLKVLNLSSKGINDLSDWKELVQTCPHVEELEISDNLISSWSYVGHLAEGWNRLKSLDLSRNPLSFPSSDETESCKNAFRSLKHMILGGVSYDWERILHLSRFWPQIDKLTVPFNQISVLKNPTGPLLQLTSIDLGNNRISDWNEVITLNALERLENINLCGNQIKRIKFESCESNSLFPALERLNISENLLQDWLSVSELNKLPKLTELRMDSNPVLNYHKRDTNRQIAIARIQKLQKLEGVEIDRQERRDAELDYIKLIGASKMTSKEEIVKEHPRYEELAEKYGISETDSKPPINNSMKSSLINLVLVADSALKYIECEKKFLKTMSVQKLKGLLQRMWKIPSVPMKITATSSKNPGITFVLEDEFMDLEQYSIEDGDTLRIKW